MHGLGRCRAPAADERLADFRIALLRVEEPVAVLPGRLMAQVLSMTAGQYCNPVLLFVLTQIKDFGVGALRPFIRPRVAFARTLG